MDWIFEMRKKSRKTTSLSVNRNADLESFSTVENG